MNNPLFEALARQINSYGIDPIFDQADPAKKTQIGEFINYLAEMGRGMIQAYQVAIGTYPPTDYKKEYMAKMPAKIKALSKTVGTPGQVKTITAQLDSLLTAVKAELTEFLGGSKNDKGYAEFLENWRNSLQLGFNNYELAITEIGKYVKTKDELGIPMTDDQYAILGKSINKIADSMEEQIAKNNILTQGIEKTKATKENSSFSNREDIKDYMVENFRKTGKMITFSEYNNALGKEIFEDKEARVTRRGVNALIDGCKNLKNQVNSVVVLISSRESFHEGNTGKFKSSSMNTQFADIAKQMDSILAQIEGLNRREKGKIDNLPELEDAYEKYSTLFTDLKEKYDTDYSAEYAKIKSVDIVNTAIPAVSKYIDDANASFNGLSNLSLEAQAAKNAEDKKKADATKAEATKADATKAAVTGKQITSKPINQKDTAGNRNDEVKAFQEAVIEKYKDDKEMTERQEYKDLKAAMDKGQGGIYGKRTIAMVKYLKDGLGIKDGKGSEITQELIDAINKDELKKEEPKKDEVKTKVPESFNFRFNSQLFEFDHAAAKKARSSSSSGEGEAKKTVKKAANNDIKPEASSSEAAGTFNCLKKVNADTKISGGKAVWTSGSGNIHTFKADGGYSFYWKSKDKTMKGSWECVGDDWKAYTFEDKDIYLGSVGDWQSNLDAAAKTKAEAAKKTQVDIAKQGKEFAKTILNALAGGDEDTKTIYDTFKKIKTKELFNATEKAFNYWWPGNWLVGSNNQLQRGRGTWAGKTVDQIDKEVGGRSDKKGFSLRGAIARYLNDSEISRLNGYLADGIEKF